MALQGDKAALSRSITSDPLSDPLISAAPPRLSLGALADVLARDYGLQGALQPLAGERDRNFRLVTETGESLLVKLAHPAENAAITDFQTAALLHLEQADGSLPVPRVRRTRDGRSGLAFDSGADGWCHLRVLSFLPGEPMGRAILLSAQCGALGGFAARLGLGLRAFSHPAQSRRLLWDIREAGCLEALLPEIEDTDHRHLVRGMLERHGREVAPVLSCLPTQVIHNDLNPHNVLVDPAYPDRPTGVIDFGDILRAPRVQEVATACAYLMGPADAPLEGPAAFVAGYAAIQPLTAMEVGVLPVMMGMRTALAIAITSWRARRQPENAAYILRNVPRVLDGLARLSALDSRAALLAMHIDERALPHV